jgi:hypothetical protein
MACAHARSEVRRSRWRDLGLSATRLFDANVNILNVLCDMLGGDLGLCSIFRVLGCCTAELLLQNPETVRDFGVVGGVVAQQKRGFAELADELCDIHGR